MTEPFDVLVLGTGAAGLTAAVTAAEGGARVAVFEKADRVGGTTANSGGMIWIPANPYQPPHRSDTREDALTYLTALSNGMLSDEIIEAYVDAGPEMTTFLEAHTPIEWNCVSDFPDFHPEQPGAASKGGRTLECLPYPWAEPGEWADRVQVSPYFPDTHIAVGETTLGQPVPLEIPPEVRQRRIDNDERGLGLSLIARLLRGCLDRDIPITTEYAVEVKSGALGTKGGPLTDATGAVQHVDGHRIEGLYAAGNAMASPMGMTYGGAGGTLGPAMIFGYLAGRDISRRLAEGASTTPREAAHA